jgi:hypothetical protein
MFVQVLMQHAIAHFFEFALTPQINAEKMRDRKGTVFRQEFFLGVN